MDNQPIKFWVVSDVTERHRERPVDSDVSELTQQDGRGKETKKPGVTSVTIILLEKHFRRTAPSFKQLFFVKDQKTLT